jgi:hypothetical protein
MTENPGMEGKNIGYIVGGGLRESLRVRLTVDPQEVQGEHSWWWKAGAGPFMAW